MYQVYKLVRAINRTYPNNGVLNRVAIDENSVLDEDIRDLINEAIHESYKEMELDEVYSFPTISHQNEYALPEDCDTSQIQEVTRTFSSRGGIRIHGVKPIEDIVYPDTTPGTTPGTGPDYTPDTTPPDFGSSPAPVPTPDLPTERSAHISDNPYYNGGIYSSDHYAKEENEFYLGWLPNHYNKGITRRLVWARDAEELTGDRYFNAWGTDRIGIYPTPTNNEEIITIYYKKKPADILYMSDDIQLKDKFMPILKYAVCMKLAMLGSNPDINMYNVFANKYDELVLEAKREKDSDMPYYQHVKDNDRPSAFLRRRSSRRGLFR